MRNTLAVVAAATLVAGVAAAQYKTPAKPPASGSIQVPTTPAGSPVQITPGAPGSGPISQQPPGNIEDARRVSQADAIKMVKEGKAVWVDVRSKDAYDAEHIKGAINVPLSELAAHYNDLPVKKFLITYCA
jgi:hypothetical protein